MKDRNRREFLQKTTLAGIGLMAACSSSEPAAESKETSAEPVFRISLAEWSLHRALQAGSVAHLDFPRISREDFGIEAVEYVNVFFFEHARDNVYLSDMKTRAEDQGVRSLLIMCDNEGDLGDSDDAARIRAVENHYKWVEAAAFLGCHSIRVNARSDATLPPEEQQKGAADGLRRLCEFSDEHGINVIVENHGGLSSDGKWLAGVMELVGHARVGTLPDFGNFEISEGRLYDRYQGVTELMPYAKAVSAKSYDFDEQGNETRIDYERMLRIVLENGYRGFVGVEYEGDRLGEPEGIRATQALLERIREELGPDFA